MIKVLHFPLADRCRGIEMYAVENWRHMDKTKVSCDFVALNAAFLMEPFFEETGAAVYYIPPRILQDKEEFARSFEEILQKQSYNILHLHLRHWSKREVQAIRLARKCGVQKIILHAHSSGTIPKFRENHYKFRNMVIDQKDLVLCACSQQAAQWMFAPFVKKHNVAILKSGIDIAYFSASVEGVDAYSEMQSFFSSGEDPFFRACFIGYRSIREKNLLLVKDILQELNKTTQSQLAFLGAGPDTHELVRWRKESSEEIVLINESSAVRELLHLSNCLIYPALYSGFPRIVLEAQACGVPCFVSDHLPRELDQTGLVHFLSLGDSAAVWAQKIREICIENTGSQTVLRTFDESWDIRQTAQTLQKMYMEEVNHVSQ